MEFLCFYYVLDFIGCFLYYLGIHLFVSWKKYILMVQFVWNVNIYILLQLILYGMSAYICMVLDHFVFYLYVGGNELMQTYDACCLFCRT